MKKTGGNYDQGVEMEIAKKKKNKPCQLTKMIVFTGVKLIASPIKFPRLF